MLPPPEFWNKEKRLLWEAMAPFFIALIQTGGESGFNMLPESVQLFMNWDVFNQDAIDFLRDYRLEWVNGISDTTRDQSVDTIADWIESGEPKPILDKRLEPILGPERAERIATTEVTRIFAKGSQLAWESTGLVTAQKWQTSQDERVCFPAWTRVRTESGDKPIQDIQPGDMVYTRAGLKSVKVVGSRKYSGMFGKIETDLGLLIGTEDHPVWTKDGWKGLGELTINDRLQSVDNEIIRIGNSHQFSVGNPDNSIATRLKEVGFLGILHRIMPVFPVHLKSDIEIGQHEINRKSSDLKLLDVFNAGLIKGLPSNLFKNGFSLKGTIAGKATELSGFISRAFSERLTTILAGNNNRWSPAFFRAIVSGIPLFRSHKFLSAPIANAGLDISVSTFNTTASVSISNRLVDRKCKSANRTSLFNHIGRTMLFITDPATEDSIFTRGRIIELATALNAVGVLSSALSFLRSKLHFFVGQRHVSQLLIGMNVLYHRLFAKPITVYNLEVEGLPEYYANGILVHNCPLCGPLHDQIVSIDTVFTQSINDVANSQQMRDLEGDADARFRKASTLIRHSGSFIGGPPRHTRCRCWLLPVVSEVGLERELDRILQKAEIVEMIAELRKNAKVVMEA